MADLPGQVFEMMRAGCCLQNVLIRIRQGGSQSGYVSGTVRRSADSLRLTHTW